MNRTIPLLALVLALVACAADPAKEAPKAAVSAVPPSTPAAAMPVAPAPSGRTETLAIDTSTSKLAWTGSKVTKAEPGGFKTFSGTITLVDGMPDKSAVAIEIDVNSLYSRSENLTRHLKSRDFFEVEKHPKASFVSTSIAPATGLPEGATHTVKGILTLHGVAKEISFPATIAVSEKHVSARAKFSINRFDWDIVYKGAADDLVRSDVLIEWEIAAKRAAGA